MFGKTDIIYIVITLISVIAIFTDLLWGKIYNWLTVSATVVGLGASVYLLGWGGLEQGFIGILAGFFIFSWMFGLRWIGGGDVKLLMALGAWGGARYVGEVGVLSILLGGVMSLVFLIFKGRILNFSRRVYYFLLPVFVKELEFEWPKIDKSLTMPFGICIAIAAICIAMGRKFGFTVWI